MLRMRTRVHVHMYATEQGGVEEKEEGKMTDSPRNVTDVAQVTLYISISSVNFNQKLSA
jgi:hypothetical protein